MSFEIRVLQEEEIKIAAGLSRYVFDYCLRNRMEFPQTITFVEEYIAEDNLKKLHSEGKLILWGAFEESQMIAVAGLQSDAMLTMLYVIPAYQNRGYASRLLSAVRGYVRDELHMEKMTLNATPAWTANYFKKKGFSFFNANRNMQVPFVSMYALLNNFESYERRSVPWKAILMVTITSFVIATIAAVWYMISYIF